MKTNASKKNLEDKSQEDKTKKIDLESALKATSAKRGKVMPS